MTDMQTLLSSLRRPRLLIRAARFGLQGYSRDRDLKRMLSGDYLPKPGSAVGNLLDAEYDLEEKRKMGDATYSIAHHVEVLIALMAEAQFIRSRSAN